jgi:transposase
MGVLPNEPGIAVVIDDLRQRVEGLEKENAELRKENAELRKENAELRKRLEKLEGKPDPDPSTPSGATPPYKKPNRRKGRKKKPGRKKGHPGARRKKPDHVDNHENHPLDCCPNCGGTEITGKKTRTRYTEDIPPVTPIVTEHTIEGGRCRNCGKWVEAKVTSVMPYCTLGNRLVLITAWMHFALGVAAHKVVTWLFSVCQMTVSAGGLTQAWMRVAARLAPLHEEIWKEVRNAQILHVDETSWRVCGQTYWLWCFATKTTVLYVIDPTRGASVVFEVLGEVFGGILVTDFYAAYNKISAWAKQKCVVHLLRELKRVSISNGDPVWLAFQHRLRRLLQDALRLGRDRSKYDDDIYDRRWKRLHDRLLSLYSQEYEDADAARLAGRLKKYRHELFTFLEFDGVDADNNHGEREIRPAVQMRKAYGGNRSDNGAHTQAVMMTIFRTLQKRKIDPVAFLNRCLCRQIEHDELPSLDQAA